MKWKCFVIFHNVKKKKINKINSIQAEFLLLMCAATTLQLFVVSLVLVFNRTNGDAPPVLPKQPEEKEPDQFDGMNVTTEKLSHPTANRAKPPQRRPPSGLTAAAQVRSTSVLLLSWRPFACRDLHGFTVKKNSKPHYCIIDNNAVQS